MIASTSDGDIWVGTRSGGLYIYDAKLEIQKKKFHHDINTYAVCEDNEGICGLLPVVKAYGLEM